MFLNYLKIAFRNLKRNKVYSIINITGLAVGLTISLIISLYVIDDLTFDSFHKNSENIYRMLTIEESDIRDDMTYSITPGPLVAALKEELPEVVKSTRITLAGRPPVSRPDQEQQNQEDQTRGFLLLAEKDFFDMFDFEILKGEKSKFLVEPGAIVITDDLAERLFGSEEPVGKPITVPRIENAYVAGVVKKPPLNSHIQFDLIALIRVELNPVWWDHWENLALSGYVMLQPGADWKDVERKMQVVGKNHDYPDIYTAKFQPLSDIHLGSADNLYDGFNRNKNDRTVVYSLAVIGLMILLIASINFVNLSSARASKRAKEVGLRKVVGSEKRQLLIQFLGESVLLTMISMILAAILAQALLPYLDTLLGKTIEIDFFNNPVQLLLLIVIAMFIGFAAGLYPALIISSFKPVTVLRGEFNTSKVGTLIRRILVVGQFTVTIALISSVIVVHLQIDYLKTVDLGYSRTNIVVVPDFRRTNNDLLKNEFKTLPFVEAMGRSGNLPGTGFTRIEAIPEGVDRSQSLMFQRMFVDVDLMNALNISLKNGRGYSNDFASDTLDAILINETALKIAGWDDPVGKRLDVIEVDGSLNSKRVVGLVKDFHFNSARQKPEPLYIQLDSRNSGFLCLKITPGDSEAKLAQIEAIYKNVYPDRNFNSFFLEDFFDRQFDNDRNFASNISLFSGIAVFIACLGLLGLVSYSVELRRREIAIRKVLGSAEKTIVYLLTSDFLKWVLVANILAWPLSYFGMGLWLDSFVYQMSPKLWPYIAAGFSTLIVALITISYQSIRASRTNPAANLRNQ